MTENKTFPKEMRNAFRGKKKRKEESTEEINDNVLCGQKRRGTERKRETEGMLQSFIVFP